MTSSLGRSTAQEFPGRRPLLARCSGWWRGWRASEPKAEEQNWIRQGSLDPIPEWVL